MINNNPHNYSSSELDDLFARYEEHLNINENVYFDADQLIDIAERYAEDEKFEEAQQALSYGLRLHPENTDLLFEKSMLYLEMNQLELAKEAAYSITENSYEVVFLKIELLLSEDKPDEAEELFQSIYDPNDIEQQIDISALFRDTDYPSYALKFTEKALLNNPDHEELLFIASECHNLLNQHDEAAKILNTLIDKDPFNVEYWTSLAQTYLHGEVYDKALNAIEFALATDDQSGVAYMLHAHILVQLERQDEAVVSYNRSIELNTIPPLFGNLFIGLAYIDKNDWKNALKILEMVTQMAIVEFPFMLIDIYSHKTKVLGKLGRYKEAHEISRKARDIDNNHKETILSEGLIYLLEGDEESAWTTFMEAIGLFNESETWMRISDYLLEFFKFERAKYCLEQVLSIDPNHDEVHNRLAIVNLLLDDKEEFQKHNELTDSPIDIHELLHKLEGFGDEFKGSNLEEIITKWTQDSF